MKDILNGILETLAKINTGAQPYYGAGEVTENIEALKVLVDGINEPVTE